VLVIENADAMLARARAHDSFGEFEEAQRVLLEMSRNYPSDKRCWRELYEHARPFSQESKSYLRKFVALARGHAADRAFLEEQKRRIEGQVNVYEERVNELLDKIAEFPDDETLEHERDKNRKIAADEALQLERRIGELDARKNRSETKLRKVDKKLHAFSHVTWMHVALRGFVVFAVTLTISFPIVFYSAMRWSYPPDRIVPTCMLLSFVVMPTVDLLFGYVRQSYMKKSLTQQITEIDREVRELEKQKATSGKAAALHEIEGMYQRKLEISKRDLPALQHEIEDLRQLRELIGKKG